MNGRNHQRYWFKRRKFGYGWTPVTWQGWLTVTLFLIIILFGSTVLKDTPRNTFSTDSFTYLIIFAIAVVILIVISLIKGPKPKWRWGDKPTDNPEEDF